MAQNISDSTKYGIHRSVLLTSSIQLGIDSFFFAYLFVLKDGEGSRLLEKMVLVVFLVTWPQPLRNMQK